MNGTLPHDVDKQELSKATAKELSLTDIRLNKLAAELHNAAPTLPLQTEGSLVTAEYYVRPQPMGDRIIVYYLDYQFSAKDQDSQQVWNASFTLSLSFSAERGIESGDLALQAFGEYGVVEIAYPYVRELLHHVTGRMSVPMYVLEILPPTWSWGMPSSGSGAKKKKAR